MMFRMAIFAAVILVAAVCLAPVTAHAQFGTGVASGDVADRVTMYLLWILLLLAVILVAMGVFSYAMAYKGHELVQRGNYQMLGALGALILAVLGRLLAFML